MRPHTTYLVGTRDSYVRYCHLHGVPVDSQHVVHVDTLELLKSVHDGQVVFLTGWETLKEHTAMYEYVIGQRAAGVLARTYADLASLGNAANETAGAFEVLGERLAAPPEPEDV